MRESLKNVQRDTLCMCKWTETSNINSCRNECAFLSLLLLPNTRWMVLGAFHFWDDCQKFLQIANWGARQKWKETLGKYTVINTTVLLFYTYPNTEQGTALCSKLHESHFTESVQTRSNIRFTLPSMTKCNVDTVYGNSGEHLNLFSCGWINKEQSLTALNISVNQHVL